MHLEYNEKDGCKVVKVLDRRLDAKGAVDFKKKMGEFVEKEADQTFILDISDVDFIDSSGLGAIVSTLKKIGNKGNLVITGPGENVMSMFKLTRMDRVFQIFSSVGEAINSLCS